MAYEDKMKITHFVVGILIIGMFVVIFSTFASNVVIFTGVSYNVSEIDQYKRFDEINNITIEMQQRSEEMKTDRAFFDIVGGFIADSKDVIDVSGKSAGIFSSLTSDLFDRLHIQILYPIVALIIIIVVVLSIIAILVGRDEV
jgi:hypothetical protein